MSDQKNLTAYSRDSLIRVFKGEAASLIESGEQWGERVDVHEYLHDTPGFSGMVGRTMHRTQIDDRQDGKYLPVYDNEMDLSMIRAMSWLLKERVPMAKAIEGRLLDYTIGNGFDWSITSKEAPEALIERLNKDVERVFDENAWTGELERESFTREFDDGEFMMSLNLEGDSIRFEVHEGEELTEPVDPRDIEEWIGIYDYVPSWRFGVLTQQNRSDSPKGYHVTRNASGTDWDFYPVENFVHWKRNVRKSAKRGVTDFYTPHTYLMRGDKVFTNTAEGAAIQAAIAYILEHAPGVSKGQAESMGRNTLVNPRQDSVTGRNTTVQRIRPGTIRQVPSGQKYHSSLLGSNQSSIYIDVMEAALRLAGTIYSMPEGMITGTYENNSYASAETAVDPWVLGRKADQSTRERRKKQLIVQIIRVLHSFGRYKEYGDPSFEQILAMIDIGVNAPDLWPKKYSSEEVTAIVTQISEGLMDPQTAATKLGNDYDQVQDRIKAGGHVKPKPTPQPGMGGIGGGVPGEEPEDDGDGSSVGQDAIDRVMARLTESEDEQFTPPIAAQQNARKVLTWLESHGEVAGLTRVGIARVKRIANGLPVGRDVVERMASLRENCGTGDGGFKSGNDCSGGGGSGGIGKVTQSQKNAVEDYTTDKFQTINSELRSGGPESKDTKKIVKEVDSFLANSPKREGATVRSFDIGDGDSEKIKSMLKEGGVFTDDAYVSTRKKPTLTDTIAFKDKSAPGGKVVMKVTGKSGVDISDISKNTGEGEVLYPRGTKFKVKKVVKTPQGGILAEVEEMTDESTQESLQESLTDTPWKDPEHVAFLGFGGAEGVEWAKKNVTFLEDCGTGAGGFKPGNSCGKGEGGKSLARSLSRAVPMSDAQSKEIAKLNPDGPVDGKVKIPKGFGPDQTDDIKMLYPGSTVDSGKTAKTTKTKTTTKKSQAKTGRRSDSELESEFGPKRSKSMGDSYKEHESIASKQKKLTKAEQNAAKVYTSEEYKKINGALRSGESIDNVPPPELKRLNSKAAKTKLPPGTVLYAGVGENTAKRILEGGDTFEHKGLRSTSVDPGTATKFLKGEPYVMEIKAKRGLAIDDSVSDWEEMEVVQAHGTKYRVIGFQKNRKLGSSSDRGGRKAVNVITLEEI